MRTSYLAVGSGKYASSSATPSGFVPSPLNRARAWQARGLPLQSEKINYLVKVRERLPALVPCCKCHPPPYFSKASLLIKSHLPLPNSVCALCECLQHARNPCATSLPAGHWGPISGALAKGSTVCQLSGQVPALGLPSELARRIRVIAVPSCCIAGHRLH